MNAQINGAGRGGPTPRSEITNCYEELYHVPTIAQTAAALVFIANSGQLAELEDEIKLVRQDWRRSELSRTIGENSYIDRVARILVSIGVDRAKAWSAVRDAVRPRLQSSVLQAIVEFAKRLEQAGRRHE